MLESLVVKPQAILVPDEQLDPIAALVQEDEEVAFEDIRTELVSHDRDETIVRLAEVDGLAAEEDLLPRTEA